MDTEDLARLLAPPGQLSRIEQDLIFERVMDRGHRRPPWYQRRAWFVGAGVVVTALCALLLVRPHDHRSTLTARGTAGVVLVVQCGNHAPGECESGDKLMLEFGATPPSGYVALLARAPDGDVIWYAPAVDGASMPLNAVGGVLDTAIVLDRYRPGSYELYAVISDVPLSRTEIRAFAQGDRLVAPPGVRIETRAFTVRETP